MECPTAEQLAANAMTLEEHGAWLDHASGCPQCRAVALMMSTPAPGPAEAPAHRIGRFVITREIGRGAMGVVYAALDPELGRTIAIKVLHDATDVERLRREARALARLDHENVLRIYDVGVEREGAFVAMELVVGRNLRQWLAETERSRSEVLRVLVQAGRGLAAAHAAGIVHRDFKPDNVLVSNERAVVGDFGLSQMTDAVHDTGTETPDLPSTGRLTMTGAAVGTPAYMAPEQARGESTAASDQFAYCIAVWEACYGVRPFGGATLRELHDHVRAGYFTRPEGRALPRRIARALRRGLAADPALRFGSMDELLAELAPRRRWRWFAAATIVVALAGVALAWRMTAHAPPDPCVRAGDAILEHWNPTARARLRSTHGDALVAELDAYTAAWRDARTATCRARAPSDANEVERRTARETCYERARVELAKQVAISGPAAELRSSLVPIEACASSTPLPEAPGTVSDARGCGCPYSACRLDTHTCVSECNARAFRPMGPVPGINRDHQQEAIVGASLDGTTLLYLSGPGCERDHLLLARKRGERFESTDLTPQIAERGLAIGEGCCTLAPDARSIIIGRQDGMAFLRLPLDGDRLGEPDARALGGIAPSVAASERLRFPVLGADQRTLYFQISSPAPERNGAYAARRTTVDQPFGVGAQLGGRAPYYEYVTGVSGDDRSLFMAAEFKTRVLVRERPDEEFGDLGFTIPPSHLPGWRAIPIEGCRRIITTMSPGGCAAEDIVYLEAIDP